jgi:hypothetical protein
MRLWSPHSLLDSTASPTGATTGTPAATHGTSGHGPSEIAGIDPFDDCDFCRENVDFDKMS